VNKTSIKTKVRNKELLNTKTVIAFKVTEILMNFIFLTKLKTGFQIYQHNV